MNILKNFISICTVFLLSYYTYGQEIKQTEYSFDINKTIDGTDYFYYFNKGKNDTFINLKIMTFNIDNTVKTLCKEVSVLPEFYNIATQKIKIDLWNMNVGNPLEYEDVLNNQINVFAKDTSWQNYYKVFSNQASKNKNIQLDYNLISKIMTDQKVYGCIELELNKIGYTISQVGIEKVGFLDLKSYPAIKKRLSGKLPYSDSQLKTIPIPYIVYIGINRIS